MATQRPGFAVPLAEFAAGLLSEREVAPRARMTAHHVAEMLPGTGVVVYVVTDQETPAWTAKAAEGEIEVAASVVEFGAGEFFGEMALFEDAPRMAQIVALEETHCVVLFRTDFFALLQKEKNVAVKILFEYARTMTQRARRILVGEVQQPGS